MSLPLIIAHRGASAYAPENTLAAFRWAIEDGAEGIELDVRLAKDGVPVVHHDETLLRTGGKDLTIAGLTSERLAKTDVGSWFQQHRPKRWLDKFSTERVPTLEAVLDSFRDFDGRILVEMKCDESDVKPLTEAVGELVRSSPLAERITVKSFRLGFVPLIRSVSPKTRTAALFAPKIMTILRKEKYLVDLAAEFGADEISVHYTLATSKLMKNAGKLGFPVTIWTVDHPRWLRRGMKLGVRAIITNDPARLLAKRAELEKN